MLPQTRYQVFVSSTYEDLSQERQQATQSILEIGSFPSGMELFPASDDSQWDLIKKVIEEADYYIVIVAGRYGSCGPDGRSYTEMEYDYAVQQKIPVLGFVRQDIENVPNKFIEATDEGKKKLQDFREKVTSRMCKMYSDPRELGMAVMKSLQHEVRVRPRVGWVRADQARSKEDIDREHKLTRALEDLTEYCKQLEREVRDRSVLATEIPREELSQGEDSYPITIRFQNNEKTLVCETIPLTWNEIFRVIGSSMYGLIIRRSGYGNNAVYPFHENLCEYIRNKIIKKVQNRKIYIDPTDVDSIIIQFKELGLIMFEEKEDFRGITLTEHGEIELSRLNIIKNE